MGFLPVNDFIGHDGKRYRDLAVESTVNKAMLVWVRRRLNDGAYFVVTSVICGHTLRKEISETEAVELYHALSTKIPFDVAFLKMKSKRAAEEAESVDQKNSNKGKEKQKAKSKKPRGKK